MPRPVPENKLRNNKTGYTYDFRRADTPHIVQMKTVPKGRKDDKKYVRVQEAQERQLKTTITEEEESETAC